MKKQTFYPMENYWSEHGITYSSDSTPGRD